MKLRTLVLAGALAATGLATAGAALTAEAPRVGPATYTADGKLILPADYRTWVYLTSGLDMSYAEGAAPANSAFDNVFVDREAYAAFQKTGAWPEGTVMALEIRAAGGQASINKAGKFQTGAVRASEFHVKDSARFKGDGWAFFGFRGDNLPQARIAADSPAGCHACHDAHAAVDTTFVQFYPTLLPKAEAMKTLSAAYLAEEKAAATKPHP